MLSPRSPLLTTRECEDMEAYRFSRCCCFILGSAEEGGAPAARHEPKHSHVLLSQRPSQGHGEHRCRHHQDRTDLRAVPPRESHNGGHGPRGQGGPFTPGSWKGRVVTADGRLPAMWRRVPWRTCVCTAETHTRGPQAPCSIEPAFVAPSRLAPSLLSPSPLPLSFPSLCPFPSSPPHFWPSLPFPPPLPHPPALSSPGLHLSVQCCVH